MNDKKICFIMCINDKVSASEAIYYINKLEVPEGYEIDCLTVEGASSMTSGYNEAMNATDAKYKVYMHQDVFIINKNFISDILKIFQDETIGMIGMIGSTILPDSGIMWFDDTIGQIYSFNYSGVKLLYRGDVAGKCQDVEAIDGLMIITQHDVEWREDIFDKWDFYDISSSFEMRRAGYRVVVPNIDKPWCIHDDGTLNYKNYHEERKKFLKEYGNS